MNITVTDQEHCKKQVKLEIPSDEVKKEIDKVAGQLSRRVTVAGFRPGHVPKSVIMTRFKKELRDEVASKMIPDAFDSAMHEKNLKVVGEPELEEFKFADDETLNISLVVEVAPDFVLTEFKNLPLTRRVYKVTEDDVNRVLNNLREREAEMVPVEDRPSQPGDVVSTSIKGSIEPAGEGAEPEKVDQRDIEVELGNDNVIEEFRTAFNGVQTGDTKEFSVTYPAEIENKKLAGKRVDYSGEVTAVRIKQLPELTDDFASSVDEEVKTLDELKAKIRHDLEHQAEHRSDSELREALRKDMLDKHKFEVPQQVVAKQAELRVRNFARRIAQENLNPRALNLDWDALFDAQKDLAEADVRWAFILDRIARAENIEATGEEVDKEIEKMAEESGKAPAALKANLTKENALGSIKEQLENRRAIDLVIASANTTIEEIEGLGRTEGAKDGDGRTENDSEVLAEDSDIAD